MLPVRLEKASFYRVGINSSDYQNFKSADGEPADPAAIYFSTIGASKDLIKKAETPEIVSMTPANGDEAVDASVADHLFV